jgi:hypothetical protein
LLGVVKFHLEEYLMWGSKSEHFSRMVVHPLYCLLHVFLGDVCQFLALGKVLPQ